MAVVQKNEGVCDVYSCRSFNLVFQIVSILLWYSCTGGLDVLQMYACMHGFIAAVSH